MNIVYDSPNGSNVSLGYPSKEGKSSIEGLFLVDACDLGVQEARNKTAEALDLWSRFWTWLKKKYKIRRARF